MKRTKKLQVQKQKFLIHTLLSNSRDRSRWKIKSIGQQKTKLSQDKIQQKCNISSLQNKIDRIQLPTFGDWKYNMNQYQKCQSVNTPHQSLQKLSTLPINNIASITQHQRNNSLIKQQSNSINVKQFSDKTKLKQYKPLYPIYNTKTVKFNGQEIQFNRKLTEKILPYNRKQKFYQDINFQTIEHSTKCLSREQTFKNLYLKQKEKYQEILKKYHIQQIVQDSDFKNFFNL